MGLKKPNYDYSINKESIIYIFPRCHRDSNFILPRAETIVSRIFMNFCKIFNIQWNIVVFVFSFF